jgi:hypothetical protein
MQVTQMRINNQSKLNSKQLGSRQSRKYSDAAELEVICKIPKVYKQKAPRCCKAFPAIEIQKTDSDNHSAYSEFETCCSH